MIDLRKILTFIIPEEIFLDFRTQFYWVNTASASIFLSILGVLYCTFYWLMGFYMGFGVTLLMVLVNLSALLMLKYARKPMLAAHLVVHALFIEITVLSLAAGSATHTDVIWFASLPVLGALTGGRKSGLYWGVVASITISIFYILDMGQVQYGLAVSLADRQSLLFRYYQIVSLVSLLMLLTAATINAETSRQKALNMLRAANIDLEENMKELQEAHAQLQASEEETRQQADTLQQINWALSETQSSLKMALESEKETAAAFKKSEEKYRMIMEQANEAIVITVGNRIMIHNNKLVEMTGYHKHELAGLSLKTLVHPHDWPLVEQRVQRGQKNTAFRVLTQQGEVRWFETVSSKIQWEGHEAIQDMIEDITERKAAEEKLRHYEVIISTATERMAMIDRDMHYVSVNEAFCKTLGKPYDEVVGKKIADIMLPEVARKLGKIINKSLKGETVTYQLWMPPMYTKGNQAVYLDGICQPVYGEGDEITHLVIVVRDITELKLAQEALDKKNRALQQSLEELQQTLRKLRETQQQLIDAEKMASLGQLTAGIAHEINNPVNFISGNISPLIRDMEELKAVAERLQEISPDLPVEALKAKVGEIQTLAQEYDLPFLFEEIYALIDGMREGANRTKEIVAGLRNFSRLDQDHLKPIDVNEAIDATLLLLRNVLKNRIEVNKQYGELPPLECYPGKLNQVFMNIINNAQQAIAQTGSISIATWQDNSCIGVTISDTGMGMSEEIRSRIFEPFFTTKEIGEGTGLGLSITYGIIEQHRGKIEVSSEQGKGTTFTILLPKNLAKLEERQQLKV